MGERIRAGAVGAGTLSVGAAAGTRRAAEHTQHWAAHPIQAACPKPDNSTASSGSAHTRRKVQAGNAREAAAAAVRDSSSRTAGDAGSTHAAADTVAAASCSLWVAGSFVLQAAAGSSVPLVAAGSSELQAAAG